MYGSQEVSTRGSRQFHSPILTGMVGAASRALAKVATKVPKVQKIALCAKFMPMHIRSCVPSTGEGGGEGDSSSKSVQSGTFTSTSSSPITGTVVGTMSGVLGQLPTQESPQRVFEVGVQADMFSKMLGGGGGRKERRCLGCPFLGAGFGSGFKPVKDDYDGGNTPMADTDPLDQCAGSLTVFGMDISKTSLDGLDSDELSSVKQDCSLSHLFSQQCNPLLSAGSSGSWFISGPGNAIDAISVVFSTQSFVYFDTFGQRYPPTVYCSTATTVVNDIWNPLPASVYLSSSSNVAPVPFCLAARNQQWQDLVALSKYRLVTYAALILNDGVFLPQLYATGAKISLAVRSPYLWYLFDFVMHGPTNDFYFKPAITTPGASIMSAFLIALGMWA
ncbi:hypothetical protein B0H13DRAFT_1867736 [Mycena leptocephala]|nr:hypothetical protein B0H13DRAFT_1867736 [Mycena leptocephala]